MNCKICASATSEFYDPLMKWHFHHCPQCECIFKNPSYYVSAEKELQIYNNHNNTIDSPGYAAMFEAFMDFTFKPHIQEISEVLEFGCGPGPVLAELMERHGLHVTRYDKYFYPERRFEGRTYDLITATEVIEHVDDPEALMDFFHKHLRSGGYLALMTQFHTNVTDEFLQWWYRKDPTHILFFTPQTFKYLARACGFTLLRYDTKKLLLLQKL